MSIDIPAPEAKPRNSPDLNPVERALRERIAALEAGIGKALKHADGNGMSKWPVFVGLRKLVS